MTAGPVRAAVAAVCLMRLNAVLAQAPLSQEGGILLQNLQVPKGERVVALELDLSGAIFESIANIPNGWRLTVNNDISGAAVLDGRAQAVSAGVDERRLQDIQIEVMKQTNDPTRFDVEGAYVLASGKRIPLGHLNFEFVERYPRRRLY